ncbi:hypothetical protein ABZ722_16635 [Streptomyces longwoodensis]|uniref:hypothetical protein n=1 Tax=Streptomyces longwoodensis TaxID=68231 RepID=UPI0033CC2E6C
MYADAAVDGEVTVKWSTVAPYRLLASVDGETWSTVRDGVAARFVRVEIRAEETGKKQERPGIEELRATAER